MILSKYFTAGSNSTLSCALDASYLAVDHQCSKQDFPCDTIQILTDHCEEVWFCKFSPDGRKYITLILNMLKEIVVKNNWQSFYMYITHFSTGKLATGSKDNTVIIWDFDPDTLNLKINKSLEPRSQGVSFFAWSPDSTRLAVCGPEDCDEVSQSNINSSVIVEWNKYTIKIVGLKIDKNSNVHFISMHY